MKMFEFFIHLATAIFFIWSAILLWASWRLWQFIEAEERQLERWKRLRRVAESQQSKWQ